MKRTIKMNTPYTLSLIASALALAAGSAAAEVYSLCAGATTKTMPDGSAVPVWGYALGGAVDGVCENTPGIPGPRLPVTDGTLTINLTNTLPEPTSVVIPGLPLPAGGPTWDDGSAGARTGPAQRVRSFGAEAASGGQASYSWAGVRPGSFVYHSGTHPQKQVYMGLYGRMVQDAASGVAYPAVGTSPAVAYDHEVELFYSEIDPDLNAAINELHNPTGAVPPYTTSIGYHPRWFLVNGEPYTSAMADIATGTDGTPLGAGEAVLLRLFSAAGETHVPVLQGMHMTIHAEDGLRYTWQNGTTVAAAAPREQYSVMLPPLKTKDAIVVAPAEGRYAVYDGNGYMTNPSRPDDIGDQDTVGGMLRFLAFGPPAANRPPVANADTASTVTATAITIDVLANDTDLDGDTLAISAVVSPTPNVGTVSCATPSCTYTPAASFVGPDTFTYTVSDGTNTAVGTVTVTVAAPNTPPVAANDSYTTAEGVALTVPANGVLVNDTDADGNPLTASVVTPPSSGQLTLGADGSFTYTPNAGFSGADSFTYRVSDGQATGTATVSITVTAVPKQHVGDLDGSSGVDPNNNRNWQTQVTVAVHDENHLPVSGARVDARWNWVNRLSHQSADVACTTGADGRCSLTRLFPRARVASATLTVTGLTRQGTAYLAAQNHDPDGDSTGTVITVSRP